MLAVLGFLTVALLLAAVMTKKLSPTGALIVIPTVTGVAASFFIRGEDGAVHIWENIKALGGYITGSGGIGSVAATGVMFIFSILFFGVLTDARTFRPVIRGVLKVIGADPVKIALGTAVLAAVVHLDGSGAVTFLVCIPALLPIYDAVGMRRTTLAAIAALSAGTMNMVSAWFFSAAKAASSFTVRVLAPRSKMKVRCQVSTPAST